MKTLWIWIRIILNLGTGSVLISVCVHVREIDKIIDDMLVFSLLQQSFGFGDGICILFIVTSGCSKVDIWLESISLGGLLRNAVIVVCLRAETTLDIKSAGIGIPLLICGHLTLTPINAHDVFLDPRRHHLFFRSVLHIIRNISFSLVLYHSVLPL